MAHQCTSPINTDMLASAPTAAAATAVTSRPFHLAACPLAPVSSLRSTHRRTGCYALSALLLEGNGLSPGQLSFRPVCSAGLSPWRVLLVKGLPPAGVCAGPALSPASWRHGGGGGKSSSIAPQLAPIHLGQHRSASGAEVANYLLFPILKMPRGVAVPPAPPRQI